MENKLGRVCVHFSFALLGSVRSLTPVPHTAKMLFDLGLLKSPPVEQILQIASLTDDVVRQAVALDYFLTQYATVGQGCTSDAHST